MEGRLLDWIGRLREISETAAVIVEGKRDYQLLKRLGVKNLYALSGKNYFDLLEELPEEISEVVLLTDVDKQGERIFRKLKEIFESQGITVRGEFRRILKELEVEEVEQLSEFFFGDPFKGKR